MRLAQQRSRPFDCILIDDTSRLGRYLPDVLRECDVLMHHGVFIYFVSDRLDSRDESFRIVHLVKGYGDERYSKDLGKKIHRGQEGCVLKGYTSGSRCYGYRNVNIEDADRKGEHGRPFVIGVRQEIIREEAEVVVRIMEMRATGTSFGRIARTLNLEKVTSPRRTNKAGIRAWFASTIKEITKNELYRGLRVWNRTQNVFNQAEGKKTARKRPQAEWLRVGVPELRIIADELWEKVQGVNRRGRDKYYVTRLGGMNRTEASRKYLFSGVMICGICGGNFTVIGGKAPNVRNGCPNYRFRDTCTNRVTILRTRLEHQLIATLSANLLDPRLERERSREFSEQLKARIELEERLGREAVSNGSQLKEERSGLQNQAAHLVDAIAKHGISALLSVQLATLEARLAEIERLLSAKPLPKLPTFTDEQIQTFVRQQCQDFCEVLAGEPEVARQEFQKRITKLVLTPTKTPDGFVLEVSGDGGLFRGEDVMLQSSLEGIAQHYRGVRIPLTSVVLVPSLLLST
jgi:site-specific DNA recombinase